MYMYVYLADSFEHNCSTKIVWLTTFKVYAGACK